MMGNHKVTMVLHAKPSGDVRQSIKNAFQVDNLAKKCHWTLKNNSFSLRKGCLHTW